MTEEEPFVGGKTRGEMRPEEDLAGCLLEDAANGFNNLYRPYGHQPRYLPSTATCITHSLI